MRLSTRTHIVVALSTLVVLMGGAGYLWPKQPSIAGLLLLAALWQAWRVVHLTGRMHRKIGYLFASLQNNDFSFGGPTGPQDNDERFLHQTMTEVCQLMAKIRHDAKLQDQYYQMMMEHMQTGIVAVDDKDFVFQTNPAALKILGLSVLTHLDQLQQTGAELHQAFATLRAGESCQTAYFTERGGVRLSLHATPLFLYNRHLRLITLHDIENEMDEKEIESWIRLIRVLTHEIMNSVAPITSLADTLLTMHTQPATSLSASTSTSPTSPSSPHPLPVLPESTSATLTQNTVEGLEIIRDTSLRLREFVENYRKLTRIPKPEPTRFEALPFFRQVAALCNDAPNYAKVQLTLTATPEPLTLYADKNLLTQVMTNLMRNAYQMMDNQPSGTLSVHAAQLSDNLIRITVSDNGPGIDPTLLNDIFIPFFTTRPEGTGIGLSLARQIIRLHGGNLKAASQPGKQTHFHIHLPTGPTPSPQ